MPELTKCLFDKRQGDKNAINISYLGTLLLSYGQLYTEYSLAGYAF